MRRIAWAIERSALGWPGAVALPLIAVAVLGQAMLLPAMHARLQAVSDEAHRARAAAGAGRGGAAPLERFYRHFGEADAVTGQLAALQRIAAHHRLALPKGEYRLVTQVPGRLKRYQITLPIAGPYPDVRRFLAQVLDELPTAALEQVVFERKRIGEHAIEAQVSLTLYLER